MENRQEFIIKNQEGEEKIVKRTTLREAKKLGLKSIGSGFGYCLEYCAYMGTKFEKNFFEKADYFVIIKEIINTNADLNKINSPNEVCGMIVGFFRDSKKLKGGITQKNEEHIEG